MFSNTSAAYEQEVFLESPTHNSCIIWNLPFTIALCKTNIILNSFKLSQLLPAGSTTAEDPDQEVSSNRNHGFFHSLSSHWQEIMPSHVAPSESERGEQTS